MLFPYILSIGRVFHAESAKANIVSFLLCYIALYNIILKVYFFNLDSTANNSLSTHKFHSVVNTAKILVHSHEK